MVGVGVVGVVDIVVVDVVVMDVVVMDVVVVEVVEVEVESRDGGGGRHHVGRRQVADEQRVHSGLHLAHHRVRHRLRSHLGLEIVGGHLGRLLHLAHLAGEGLLAAAVEEEGHVRVLLGLGHVELGEAQVGDDLAQPVGLLLRREDHGRGEGRAVLGHLHAQRGLALLLGGEERLDLGLGSGLGSGSGSGLGSGTQG